MIKTMYVVQDVKAAIFEAPVSFSSDAVAIRWFARCIEEVPMMSANPQDFSLYKVGVFDDENGHVSGCEVVDFVISGINCLKNRQREMQENETTTSQVGDESPVQSSS